MLGWDTSERIAVFYFFRVKPTAKPDLCVYLPGYGGWHLW